MTPIKGPGTMTPEEIAAGLDSWQVARLLAIQPGGKLSVPRGYGAIAAREASTMPSLIERYWRGDANGYRLTPLGLAVKRHLEAHHG